jgi:threonine synthase
MRMGLPLHKLVVATNANDIVARALNEGLYESGHVHATLSPSMDIQVSSNFERALFEASGRDAAWTRDAMESFAVKRSLRLPDELRARLRSRYGAGRADDAETLDLIARTFRETGCIVDPHTAVALRVAEKLDARLEDPIVVLSTAHPAKFPDAVARATGQKVPLPPRLAALYDGVERVAVLPHDLGTVRGFIEERLRPA